MTHFGFGTRTPSLDPGLLQSVQGTLAGLDLEDTFQVTRAGLISTSDPMTVAEQQQTAQAISAGLLAPASGPSTLFTRNVSPVDVWSLAHVGVGALLALSGFGPLALAVVAASTEGIEFVLQRGGIIQDETIQNRIGDVVAAGIGFAVARALI